MSLLLVVIAAKPVWAQDELAAWAVVSEPPKDLSKISAKALVDGVVADLKLIPTEAILNNLIWKKLEICHSMKLEGTRTTDGFRVASVRVIDAGMLPMALQGFAGDCLIKKAVEVAPLVD
jgi:hypothetical protein